MKITNTLYLTHNNYDITCQSFETQYSWGHIVKIVPPNSIYPLGYAKINYLNRTWERYQYQSAILSAIKDAKDTRIFILKRDNNIKRLTKQRKQELIQNDTIYNELCELYEFYCSEYQK